MIVRVLVVVTLFLLSSPWAIAISQDAESPITLGRSLELKSKILEQTRRINVYTPAGYSKGTEAYPVLYLLDGGVHEDFLHIAGLASLAADYRKIRPFIVVGIEGIDRRHDFTYPSNNAQDQKDVPTAGGAADFRRFLGKELQPFIRSRFRTTSETVLIGESLAGLFVVETFLKAPALFDAYVSVSPSLWWDDGSLAKKATSLIQTHKEPLEKRRLFLTIADEGGIMREAFDQVVQALRAEGPKNLSLVANPMTKESHGTIFHPAALRAIRHLFATKEKK